MPSSNPGTVNYKGQRIYNDPAGGAESSIGVQFNTFYYQKKALIEAKKEQFFGQLADVTSMPKNMGKTIKKYHYLPLLDDGNINDQGIDAAGKAGNGVDDGTVIKTIAITSAPGSGAAENPGEGEGFRGEVFYITGEAVTNDDAETAAEAATKVFLEQKGFVGIDYATITTAARDAGWWVDDTSYDPVPYGGNLYGSSKDVGTIVSKMPALSETGGRVNRVGFKRIELQGSIEKFGFFDEYTQESLDFDTDAELEMHINREMIMGANEITEDALQIDLLNAAGVVRYAGDAASTVELTGEVAGDCELTYDDLMRLSIDLDDNRCPKNTKIITGSRMIDTKTIDAARYMYIGSELIPLVKNMVDNFGNQAFIPVQRYGAATQLAMGEIGSVDQFRIIVVPEMMHWAGAGADATLNAQGYRTSVADENAAGVPGATERYDVFPMLVVGSQSFTTIGFQTDGKTVKFKITHKAPGKETADWNDPYGEVGFMSIKWYYGIMILRPERIALIKTPTKW